MKKILFYCLMTVIPLFFGGISLSAQNARYRIRGVVTDVEGEPVIGAAIFEEGASQRGVVTDADGTFALDVSNQDAIINISSLGYKTLQLPASSSEFAKGKIVLEEDSQLLDDAVVIGYGTVRREDMTGAVAAIKAEEINRGAVSSSYELLQGKIPGLLVLSNGTMRVRGVSSLNASNDPLVVIDGIPVSSNGLSSLNPDDIDSFSVLKDASSAAIYGSRAASGVILVTTKKAAASRKPRITYSGSASVSHYIGREDVMSADEYRSYIRELYASRPGSLEAAEALMGDANTDWIDLVTRMGQRSTHNIGISGTAFKGKLPYRLSLGYMQSIGQRLGSWSHRPTINATISPTLLDNHLSISLNTRINTSISSDQSASYGSAASFNPTLPVYFYNPDGSIDTDTNYGYYIRSTGRGADLEPSAGAETNPMQYSTNDYDVHNLGWTISGTLNYKVHGLEDLALNLRLSTDRRSTYRWSSPKPGYWGLINNAVAPRIGTNTTSESFNSDDMMEFFVNYKHEFKKHSIDAMAGYSWERFYTWSQSTTRYNGDYTDTSGVEHKEGDIYGTNIPHGEEHFLVSFYGRLNYSFMGRYLLTFTLRDDGSSRFAKENRWGLFPSVAAAWNIKKESFLKDVSLFDELKLRLGWGVTGQETGIANYSYIASYSLSTSTRYMYNMGSDGRVFYLTPSAYDPNIKWEETITANIGLDFGFGNGAFNGNLDLYKKTTKDLLNSVSIPMGANFSNNLLTNIGSMENKGIELGLTWNPIRKRDKSLSINGNVTYQDTKFTKLTVGDESTNADYFIQVGSITGGTGGYLQQHRVGYAPNTFYLYQQAYDENGNPIQNAFIDRDGDGVITENDRYLTGKSPLPKVFYGLNVKGTWKQWDFGFNAHGYAANWGYWDYHQANSTPANDWINYSSLYNYRNIVKKTGWTSTSNTAQGYSDYFLYDASFFKIDDVNIGYNFRNLFGTNARLRLAFTVNNVLTLTRYPGVDPELSTSGIDSSGTPKSRTYSVRVNVNF